MKSWQAKQRHFWKGGGGGSGVQHLINTFVHHLVRKGWWIAALKWKKNFGKIFRPKEGRGVNPWKPSPKIRQWKDFSINLMLNFRNEFFFRNVANILNKTRHVFVKHRCPRQQQSPNMAKSLSPKFWPRPAPRGMWCQWSVSNHYMNLQSKFGYCMTTQTLNIALCL